MTYKDKIRLLETCVAVAEGESQITEEQENELFDFLEHLEKALDCFAELSSMEVKNAE